MHQHFITFLDYVVQVDSEADLLRILSSNEVSVRIPSEREINRKTI